MAIITVSKTLLDVILTLPHFLNLMQKIKEKSIKLGYEMAVKKELENVYMKLREVLHDTGGN